MSVSTRLSIYWPESQVEKRPEETDTIVLTTPSGKYIDIRSYKSQVLLSDKSLTKFPFEWAFAGNELPVKNHPSQVEFSHDFFDSSFILKYCRTKRDGHGSLPCRSDIPIDCGTFKTLDNGVREETGKMKNESTGNFESYIEHWITLDPLKSTPTNMLPLQVVQDGSLNYALFDILENKQNFEGRFIRLGVWAQGLLWDKKNLEFPISIVRLHLNNKNWDIIISFGRRVPFFKSLASTEVHNGEIVKNFDVIWTCLEAGII